MIKILRKKRQKGFTLIELVVVIAILGILAALAVPKFVGTLENAKLNSDEASIRTIESAVQLYYVNEDAYPANVAALVPAYLDATPQFQSKTYVGSAQPTIAIDANNGAVTVTKVP